MTTLAAAIQSDYARLIAAAETLGKQQGSSRETTILEQALRRANAMLSDIDKADLLASDEVDASVEWLSEDAHISDRFENAIAGAYQHGEDSDPDHVVGDLQDLLRAAVSIMQPDRAKAFFEHEDTMKAVLQAEAGASPRA